MAPGRTTPLGRGYTHIYTGNGKGKTTAALGLAFRAAGHGLRSYIGQFMKGQPYGELEAAKRLHPYITVEQYGRPGWVHVAVPPAEEDLRAARAGLEKARSAMRSGQYDLVVLDEILTAHHFHLLSLDEMLDLVGARPEGMELILTGRDAPPELVERADLVTEMREVKHPYQRGVLARAGIEY